MHKECWWGPAGRESWSTLEACLYVYCYIYTHILIFTISSVLNFFLWIQGTVCINIYFLMCLKDIRLYKAMIMILYYCTDGFHLYPKP